MSPVFAGWPSRRVVIIVIDFEAVAGLQVALEVHLVGEHADHLDHDVGGNARLHAGEIEAGIDGGAGAVVMHLQLFLHHLGGEAAVGGAGDGDVLVDGGREMQRQQPRDGLRIDRRGARVAVFASTGTVTGLWLTITTVVFGLGGVPVASITGASE